jgi:hypothetical protein
MSSWVENYDLVCLEMFRRQFEMFLERNPTKKKYEIMEEIEQQIKETREDAMIAYIEQNKPVTFQDLMERFKVNELYAKTLLIRVTKLKV